MPIDKHFRFREETVKKLEETARVSGLSETEYLERLVNESGHGAKIKYESIMMRWMPLKYQGNCLKCGKSLAVGDWAYWGPSVGVVCEDCYIHRIGDKSRLRMTLTKKDLTEDIRVLQEEKMRLAEHVQLYQTGENLDRLEKKNSETDNKIDSFFVHGLGTEDERKEFEEIKKLHEDEANIANEAKEFLRRRLISKKKVAIEA